MIVKNLTLKIVIITVILLFTAWMVAFTPKRAPAYDPVFFYNRNGRVYKIMKVFSDTITPSTGNGYSLDISASGFTSIVSISAMAQRNTSTATSSPNVGVKSYTTSAIVFNMTEGNADLINILGSNVLLGPSTQFSSASGLLLHVTVVGY